MHNKFEKPLVVLNLDTISNEILVMLVVFHSDLFRTVVLTKYVTESSNPLKYVEFRTSLYHFKTTKCG